MPKKLIKKQFLFEQKEEHLQGVGEVQGYYIIDEPHTKVVLMCNSDNRDDWEYFTLAKIEYKPRSKNWVFKMIASPISKEELHFPVADPPKDN